MYRPRDLHELLNVLGTGPKKSLSQNFLIDGNIIRKIVDTAKVAEGESVLEIGPGPGALTQELLARGAHVTAVEKDTYFAKHLSTIGGHLQVFCQDILDFDFSRIGRTKVIANLPYHITTPIVTKLVQQHAKIVSLVIMVQYEVAKRMVAKPGSKDYGSLTVFLNYHTDAALAFKVSRSCFHPKPKVDSAVVTLTLKEPPVISDSMRCLQLIRQAFGQRRKMLRKSWGEEFGPLAVVHALTKMNLPETARPEELSLEQFITLFEELS